jgi:hypothetical protein
MVSKKALLDNALMREIIRIRYDTLQRMLTRRTMGLLPGTTEEGATGKYDNKGAILIPGGLIYQDLVFGMSTQLTHREGFTRLIARNIIPVTQAIHHDNRHIHDPPYRIVALPGGL